MSVAKPLNLFRAAAGSSTHTLARRELLKGWAADPWAFLTGRDVDGKPMIVTQDEIDEARPFKAFPTDKPYLQRLTRDLFADSEQTKLVDKSRQMMVSTLCMLLLYWLIMFKRGRKAFVSKQTQELAEMLLADKVRGVHERTPEWFQAALPLSMKPSAIARAHTGSEIICVAQNAAVRSFKGNTASVVLIDEAAVQEEFENMLQAAGPMAGKIWAVTTAFHGNPGAATFRRLSTEV
jgi:hypothetical protein